MNFKITLTRIVFIIACVATAVGCTQPKESTEGEVESVEESTGNEPAEASIPSPRQEAVGTIGTAKITVDYGSPAVKGREVWGGLEAYGEVWRAGANETTSIEFSSSVTINDVRVEKGKYGFYLIPMENEAWVAVINKDWDRDEHGAWGAYNYSKENDIVRMQVEPEWLDEVQERLSYAVVDDGILLAWEKLNIKVPIGGGDE